MGKPSIIHFATWQFPLSSGSIWPDMSPAKCFAVWPGAVGVTFDNGDYMARKDCDSMSIAVYESAIKREIAEAIERMNAMSPGQGFGSSDRNHVIAAAMRRMNREEESSNG